MTRAVVRFFAVCAVSPAMVLGPCYGEVMISLPTGIGVSTSGSLLPDRSARREVEGQVEEQGNIARAPVVSPWVWSDHDPAWQPFGELAEPPQSFLAFWETSSSFLASNSVEILMPLPLEAEVPVQGGEMAPTAEIDPDLAPGEPNEEGWVPEVGEGAPAEAAADPAVSQGPVNPVLAAQMVGECTVMGEVSDKTTLDPIVGAIVTIGGTGREAETDAQGRFRVDGLPTGTYLVEALKLGYSMGSASASPRPEAPAEVRIALTVKPGDTSDGEFVLAEEVVVGEYRENTQGDFNLNLDIENTVTSGLGKDDFSKTGVSDAAGAVGKVAGANIVGGKFAVVRGLADRYVTTLFNGASISSADPSRKAVQLDIFPTTAIERVDVAKTYWPNLPGDFGGGTIKITSLSIPDERFGEVKYRYGMNSTHGDRMLVNPSRDLGFWGDVDDPIPDQLLWNLDANGQPDTFNVGGNRVTPGNTNTSVLVNRQLEAGLAEQALADEHLKNMRALDGLQSFMPAVTKPQPSESLSLVYGDTIEFDNGNRFGFVGAFKRGTNDEVNPYGIENRLTNPSRSWMQESYSRELNWSLYLGAGFEIGDHHKFTATYFNTHLVNDNVTHGTDFQVSGDIFGSFAKNDAVIDAYGASAVYSKEFWTIDPVIRDTELIQLQGTHSNDVGTSLSWSLTDSLSRESRPHSSNFQTGMLDFTDPSIAAEAAINPEFIYDPSLGRRSVLQYSTFVDDGIGTLDSSRDTQFIEEDSMEASLDLSQSIFLTSDEEEGRRFEFSLGGSHLGKKREQSGRVYLLRTASWESWIQRNPPSWWTDEDRIAPFSPGSPLSATTFQDGSALPDGYMNLGEYLAGNPDALADYYNGYASENTGSVPGTGTSRTGARYVEPDAPFYLNGSGLEVRNVDSELKLTGVYGSANYYGDSWQVGLGGRWEKEVKEYEVAASPLTRLLEDDPSRFGDLTTEVFIPAVAGGFDIFSGQHSINMAWSRTVARPTFHEFLPIESISQDTGIVRRGNPDLSETRIDNFDLSADLNFSENFSGRVSMFHKNLDQPIVVVQRVDLGVNSNTYQNGDKGVISGIELEGGYNYGPFSLFGNYAYIHSKLEYEVNQGIVVTPLETRFPFQPSQILNITLGWEPEDSPWGVFLTTNFTDEYPTILRSEPDGYDVWTLPQLTLDLRVQRVFEFDDFEGTLALGCRNLTGEDRRFEYRGGPPGGPSPFDGLTYTNEDPGRQFYLEVKAEF